MTTVAPNPPRSLPTAEEVGRLFSAEREHLLNIVRSMSGVSDVGWREDVVQWVFLKLLQKIENGEPFVETTLWQYVCWRARNRIIDLKRRGELQMLEDLAGRSDDGEVRPVEVPGREPTPLENAADRERYERKKKLLSDILEEYSRRCESQPRMLSGKEILERMLRGETADETAAAMGMERNAVDKARRDARLKLRDLMSKHDVHRTVFQTFYRREMEHPYQGKRKNNGQVQAPSVSDLFHWIMDEAGALCPQKERLRKYLHAPGSDDYRDIRYHVEDAPCPLCAGLLAAWRKP
ncbi:MAG: sigma-70 family RNA polymerase sigma factor [Planctomycetes bacterium]|nr:sigma-70 family RNA polymerase sigma factor [Planctomycetota bacterium]